MADTMRAARFYGPGDIRVERIPIPTARPGEVKVKVAWNGICGSDLHAYLTTTALYASATPNPLTGETAPVTLGHEFSGTVVACGAGVDTKRFPVGQNVVVEPVLSCMRTGTCAPCAAGSRNTCPDVSFIGISGRGGGLAEYITVEEKLVHPIPDNIPLDVAACIEPLAVAWHAVKRSGFKKGDSALVVGGGPIGLFLLKVLRSIDADAPIFVSEPAAIRRSLATDHGATAALDPRTEDVRAAVRAATEGAGATVAFDAAGVQASIDQALAAVRPRGTVVVVALWETTPQIDLNALLLREVVLTGVIAYDRVHAELIAAVGAGRIPRIAELITRRVDLGDVVGGFRALVDEKDSQVKILVHP